MANTEKNVNENVETVENTEKVAGKKKSNESEINYREQYEKLQVQVDALMKMIASMNPPAQAPKDVSSFNQEVKIVHLVQRAPGLTTTVRLSNLEISMSEFGEERTIDRRQAEELVGNHRSLFEDGVIAFGEGCDDLAKRLSVKSFKSYGYMNSEFVKNLGRLSVHELEDLYGKLCDGHKAFVVEYFKRKIMEKDPAFMDVGKIDVINRLSGKAMSDVLLDRDRDEVNASVAKKK